MNWLTENLLKKIILKELKMHSCFQKYTGGIENIGIAKLEILSDIGLEDIQVIMLPADND